MRNIVGHDTNLHTTPDSLLIYFYQRDSVFQLTADNVLKPPDEIIYSDKYILGAIHVDKELFNKPFTLDEMLNYIDILYLITPGSFPEKVLIDIHQ